jgi:GYF domain 2
MNIIYYYFHNGGSQEGPFTLEEILKQPIKPTTPIWKEGEPVWQDAMKFSEFEALFASTQRQSPPPFSPPPIFEPKTSPEFTQKSINPPTVSKPNNTNRVFKTLFFLVLIGFGVVFFMNTFFRSGGGGSYSGGSSYSERTSTDTYQEKKVSVLEVERANPSSFLAADGNYNRTLFGKKIKVHGTVTNRATVANFKDITIEVIYYSDTRSEIERERFVLYDFVPAHSTKSFEWKIKPPSGTNTIGWNAINAVPY